MGISHTNCSVACCFPHQCVRGPSFHDYKFTQRSLWVSWRWPWRYGQSWRGGAGWDKVLRSYPKYKKKTFKDWNFQFTFPVAYSDSWSWHECLLSLFSQKSTSKCLHGVHPQIWERQLSGVSIQSLPIGFFG